MSEDCDFRMRLKTPEAVIGKDMKRNALRQFRHDLVGSLRENGFVIAEEDIRVRNEGQFMSVRAQYPSIYPAAETIKPFLALDFFLGNVKTPFDNKPVTTLIKQTLGEKVDYPEIKINSVSVIETAAEKWVALTRRVATSTFRKHYRDTSLVRHIYDLFKINQQGLFNDQFQKLITKIVMDDRQQYKQHNLAYFENPILEIKRAINEINDSPIWQVNWHHFVNAMVFEKEKPNYNDVIKNLNEKTEIALNELEKVKIPEAVS